MAVVIEPLDGFSKLSPEQIAALEKSLGHVLPDVYKRFLLTHNGGICNKRLFAIDALAQEGTLAYFSGLKDDYSEAQLETRDLRWLFVEFELFDEPYLSRLHPDLFPIGMDKTNNVICISISDGRIHLWQQRWDFGSDEQSITTNTYLISNSLAEFLEKLR